VRFGGGGKAHGGGGVFGGEEDAGDSVESVKQMETKEGVDRGEIYNDREGS